MPRPCRICTMPDDLREEVERTMLQGATQREVTEVAARYGIILYGGSVATHRRHLEDTVEREPGGWLEELVAKLKLQLAQEMEGEPPLVQVQYVIIIGGLDDIFNPRRRPDLSAVTRAVEVINKARGGSTERAGIEGFLAGALAMAEKLTAGEVTTDVRVGPAEIGPPASGQP